MDLDDLWVIAVSQGYSAGLVNESFFESALACFLDIFDELQIRVTFFVVAGDLLHENKKTAVLKAYRAGHEIANHSLTHCPYFRNLNREQKQTEIYRAHDLIEEKIGCSAVGFKAPNYNFAPELVDFLIEKNYIYDSSLLTTPYSNAFSFVRDKFITGPDDGIAYLSDWRHGFYPQKPFLLPSACGADKPFHEIGVSVIPWLRLPFHSSYIMALEKWKAGKAFFNLGLGLSSFRRINLNYSFHLFDLADEKICDYMPFFHRHSRPLSRRIELVKSIIRKITETYAIIPTRSLLDEGYSNV